MGYAKNTGLLLIVGMVHNMVDVLENPLAFYL